MPTVRPGYLTQVPTTTFGLGKSDTASRQAAFPGSPAFTDYLDAQVRETFSHPAELTGTGRDALLSDGGYAFGSVPRNYRDAPDLTTVAVGGGGLPGSPFGPNIASPGAGNGLNPASIPATGVEATRRVLGPLEHLVETGGGPFVSPNTTTNGIVPRTLGQNLLDGVGSGNTFRIRIV